MVEWVYGSTHRSTCYLRCATIEHERQVNDTRLNVLKDAEAFLGGLEGAESIKGPVDERPSILSLAELQPVFV